LRLGLFDEIGLSQDDFAVVDRAFGTAHHSGQLFTSDYDPVRPLRCW
jgi:hypothetical protein